MSKNKTLNIIPDKKQLGKYYLILAFVVALVFGNTLFNGYNMDDHLVTQNHKYTSKGISAIKDILSSNYYSNNVDINFDYRPLVHISFALEHQFFGEHALVSHLINLVLYLLTILLLFKLCLKWFGVNNIDAALLTSLIFAVHPIHTEAVASIKNRDELLALLFGLFAVYSVMKYLTENHFKWLLLGFFAFSLIRSMLMYMSPSINPLFSELSKVMISV
jgi:4-amino-4-deoxy-L-arabinose transferase-like glycosyltransferase